ncbi:hypothetical protein [Streptomyces sp. WM6378]|uniref:hypothetical protein n=1 Tax=Streptomyces sp. WM6378 TaxID=1415557 RepID=UPI0006AE3A80|nr:hypothetical protein [Streptomyces sp. WM6378]KOU35062.1 hypothetical protein ADK54_38295 [Streptomyces sp. WM6378]
MAATAHPFVVGPGDGTPVSLPIGGSGTIMADGGRTDGALVIMELVVPSMGMEEFFQNYTHLLPDPADQAALAELGHAVGVSFVGPPLAVSDPL